MAAGELWVVGLGPGEAGLMTGQAREALFRVEVVVGYQGYLGHIAHLLKPDQIVHSYPLTREVDRAQHAVDLAEQGRRVALVSSGDAGVYGMAGLVWQILSSRRWDPESGPMVEVVPGVSAMLAAAARLGAPLMHDFVAISLSDRLTPPELIAQRVRLAALGDFVVVFYNPRSQSRVRPLASACQILLEERAGTTPVALVRQAYRSEETLNLTTLDNLAAMPVDMLTTIIVGNSQTFVYAGKMITPRGYPLGSD
ncbi:MAG: precorrin-3B C(17)-methyltransferase [Thermaerobacter sp.]|nr:precorrin-3B C(17)-methyltransferase [Thermaerobacter sp.]